MKKVYLTIDLETDWGGRSDKAECVDLYLGKILAIIHRQSIDATFFLQSRLLRVVDQELMYEIKDCVIASHGDDHNIYRNKNANLIKEDMRLSKVKIEEYFSKQVQGFRIPQFRYKKQTLENMQELGFRYDSSIVSGLYFPFRYNGSNFPLEIFNLDGIKEYPVSRFTTLPLPCGLLWLKKFDKDLSRLLSDRQYLNIYLHPFDFSPAQGPSRGLLNLWYGQSNMLMFFEKLIVALKEGDYEFEVMS